MAYDTVIPADALALSGAPAAFVAAFTGKTYAQAAELIDAIILVRAGLMASDGLQRYGLDGQNAEMLSVESLNALRSIIKRMASETAGPIMIPLEFGA